MATTDMNAQMHIKDGNGNVNNIFPATKIANVEGLQTALNSKANTSDVTSGLADKVDKETGKGLSTNDYTTTEKNKLAGIAAGATAVTVDSTLSGSSTNAIQNKAVKTALDAKFDAANVSTSVPASPTDSTVPSMKLVADTYIPNKGMYVTPQMFGAKADGTTDDYAAFAAALATGKPILLPAGRYKLSQQLVFDNNTSDYMGGIGVGTDAILIAFNGIKVARDNLRLEHFWLRGDDSLSEKIGNGITFSGQTNGCVFNDILIAHYDTCISNIENNVKGYTFGNSFNFIRAYESDKFILFKDYGSGFKCYNISFTNCWSLTVKHLGTFENCRIEFNDCILFVRSIAFGTIDWSAELEFNSCSYETGELRPSSSTYIFYNGGKVTFRNCNYIENCNTNVYWIVNVNNGKVFLNECTFSAYNDDVKAGGLLNITFSTTCKSGSVEMSNVVRYAILTTIMELGNVQAMAKYNVKNGVGIAVQGTENDLTKGCFYTKIDNSGSLIGRYYYNGSTLQPIGNAS